MDVCVDEVSEIAEAGLFGSGVNDDVGCAGFRGEFLDHARGVTLDEINVYGASCGNAVASRETGDVMLFREVIGQPRAEKTTTNRNPDVQANLPSGSN